MEKRGIIDESVTPGLKGEHKQEKSVRSSLDKAAEKHITRIRQKPTLKHNTSIGG